MSTQPLLLRSLIPFPPSISFDSRTRFPGARATAGRKRANLVARKKKRVKLPEYPDGHGRALSISEFLHHPSGVEALLNTRALEGFESLGSNTYRCFLQKIQLLMLEVAPVLELRVIPTSTDCTVEMLSCTFEDSEYMKRQNDLFSASMRNHITWELNGSETFLDVDVDLILSLEVYTRQRRGTSNQVWKCFYKDALGHQKWKKAMLEEMITLEKNCSWIWFSFLKVFTQKFSLLPISAVEKPGNLVMQGLLDRYVPLLAEQLQQDYAKWVHQQFNL